MKKAAGFLFLLTALGISAHAATLSIDNKILTVTYAVETGSFSVAGRASHDPFLTAGNFEQTFAAAKIEKVKDAVFGSGTSIRLSRADGNTGSLEVYPGLPFVLLRGVRHNGNSQILDVSNLPRVRFTLDLGCPASALRTMGTAGLTTPDKNPGSYLFLTLANPANRRGVVAGFLTSDRGSGVLFSEMNQEKVEFSARVDYGHLLLEPGDWATEETLAIGLFDDARIGEEQFADAIARQYQIKLRPQAAGYCTWYSNPHGGAADEKSIVELADFVAKELKPFGFSFVQIDDEWQDGGTFNGPRRGFDRVKPNGPYAQGMKPVADHFSGLGLTAGIWFLPFARNHQDPEYKDRQDWFVKRPDGKPYETAWGGTSLDLTRPEVQTHLASLVKTIHGWGYRYFKMDGLWTGSATEQIYVNDGFREDNIGNNSALFDPKKTNIEAMRDGLKLVRKATGPDVFFSGCNLSQNMRSLAGSIGLVDSMRIGPDNGQGWADYREEIGKNQCGTLITGPVRGTRLYFLHGRVWWNDPDPSYVRSSVPLDQARLLTSWVALSGQFYLNSDWIPGLPAERLDIIKRTIPAHGATARPVDYFDSIMPGTWLVSDIRHQVKRDVLGLFNWERTNVVVTCSTAKAGLASDTTYHAFDFWANAPVPSFQNRFQFDLLPSSCRVIGLRAAEGHPILVSTSRHVTQGMVDVVSEKWGGKTLSGVSQVVGNDPYELRLAGLNDGGRKWRPVSVSVSREDEAGGVVIALKSASAGEEGWARVSIASPVSRSVKWTVRFAAL